MWITSVRYLKKICWKGGSDVQSDRKVSHARASREDWMRSFTTSVLSRLHSRRYKRCILVGACKWRRFLVVASVLGSQSQSQTQSTWKASYTESQMLQTCSHCVNGGVWFWFPPLSPCRGLVLTMRQLWTLQCFHWSGFTTPSWLWIINPTVFKCRRRWVYYN